MIRSVAWGLLAPILILIGVGSSLSQAQSPDNQFMLVYNLIQQAERTQDPDAAARYLLSARDGLLRLSRQHPNWNDRIIRYRMRYISEKLEALQGHLPQTIVPPPPPSQLQPDPTNPSQSQSLPQPQVATTSSPAAESSLDVSLEAPPNEVLSHFNQLNRHIRDLTAERENLEARLREALSAQPAPVDPREFQLALARVSSLQATNQFLLSQLESQSRQRQDLIDRVVGEETQHALAETRRKLIQQEQTTTRLERERQALQKQLQELQEGTVKSLKAQNEALQSQLNELQSDSNPDQQIAHLASELGRLQRELDEVKSINEQLAADKADLERQLAGLGLSDSEETRLLVASLEANLAVAHADIARQSQRIDDLNLALDDERAARQRLANENARLMERLQSLGDRPQSLDALQSALETERTERMRLQSHLQTALAHLTSSQTRANPLSPPSQDSHFIAQQSAAFEVSELRFAILESARRESNLQSSLDEVRDTVDRLEQEKRALERRIARMIAQPTLNPIPQPEIPQDALAPSEAVVLEAKIRQLESDRDDMERRLLALSRTALENKPKRRFFPSLTPVGKFLRPDSSDSDPDDD